MLRKRPTCTNAMMAELIHSVSSVKHSLRSITLKRGLRFGASPLRYLRQLLLHHLHLHHQMRMRRKKLRKGTNPKRMLKLPKLPTQKM